MHGPSARAGTVYAAAAAAGGAASSAFAVPAGELGDAPAAAAAGATAAAAADGESPFQRSSLCKGAHHGLRGFSRGYDAAAPYYGHEQWPLQQQQQCPVSGQPTGPQQHQQFQRHTYAYHPYYGKPVKSERGHEAGDGLGPILRAGVGPTAGCPGTGTGAVPVPSNSSSAAAVSVNSESAGDGDGVSRSPTRYSTPNSAEYEGLERSFESTAYRFTNPYDRYLSQQ